MNYILTSIICSYYFGISQIQNFPQLITEEEGKKRGSCKSVKLGENPQESHQWSSMYETSLIRVFHQLAFNSFVFEKIFC